MKIRTLGSPMTSVTVIRGLELTILSASEEPGAMVFRRLEAVSTRRGEQVKLASSPSSAERTTGLRVTSMSSVWVVCLGEQWEAEISRWRCTWCAH